jgi:hypothetical protein
MSRINNSDRKAALALAMATGATVKQWADDNAVPHRTAYSWAKCPEVIDQVEQIRRQFIDQAVGKLCQYANAAADKIALLADQAESEAVQLGAARAVLNDLMAISNYAALNGRMAQLERRLADAKPQ